MKQNRCKVGLISSEIFRVICISSVMALQVYLSGCATPKALDLAKRKASCSYLNLTSVTSAVEQENGDMSVCVELNDSNTKGSMSYTFTLPLSSLAKDATPIGALGFRPSLSSPVGCYWYPIEKATRGCVASNQECASPEAFLPVERLTVPVNDKPQLYDIMSTLNREPDGTKKLYEVTFEEEARAVEPYPHDPATDTMVSEQSKERREVVLVCYPSQAGQETIKPLIIAGGYKDRKTNLYYLLVPPALAWDTALIAGAVGIMAIGSFGGIGVPGPFTVTTVSP